ICGADSSRSLLSNQGDFMEHRIAFHRVRVGAVVPTLALTIALLGACGSDNSGSSSATTAAGAPTTAGAGTGTTGGGKATSQAAAPDASKITKGGNLTVLQATDAGSFDPTKQGTLSGMGNVDSPVYDSFIYLDNKTGKPKPLVVDLSGSADAKTWTFKIVKPN